MKAIEATRYDWDMMAKRLEENRMKTEKKNPRFWAGLDQNDPYAVMDLINRERQEIQKRETFRTEIDQAVRMSKKQPYSPPPRTSGMPTPGEVLQTIGLLVIGLAIVALAVKLGWGW